MEFNPACLARPARHGTVAALGLIYSRLRLRLVRRCREEEEQRPHIPAYSASQHLTDFISGAFVFDLRRARVSVRHSIRYYVSAWWPLGQSEFRSGLSLFPGKLSIRLELTFSFPHQLLQGFRGPLVQLFWNYFSGSAIKRSHADRLK